MVARPLTTSAANTAHSRPSGWFAALSAMIGMRMMPLRMTLTICRLSPRVNASEGDSSTA